MLSGKASLPQHGELEWLPQISQEVRGTEEWRKAMQATIRHIVVAVTEKNALLFSDLSAEQRIALVDQIEREVLPLDADYANFARNASARLAAVLHDVSLRRSSSSGARRSRLAFMVDVASEGAAALLAKWPDRFSVIRPAQHSGLAATLRREVWTQKLAEVLVPLPRDGELSVHPEDAIVHDWCSQALKDTHCEEAGEHLSAIKSAVSHLRVRHKGGGSTPLVYLALPVAVTLAGGEDECGGYVPSGDGRAIVEHVTAMMALTNYTGMFDAYSGFPRVAVPGQLPSFFFLRYNSRA